MAVTVRLVQGMCLGDQILLAGACVYLAKKHGKLRVPASANSYQSVCDLYAQHPEIEPYTQITESSTDQTASKLVDPDDPKALIKSFQHREGVYRPTEWYEQLGVPFKERWDSSPVPAITEQIEPLTMDLVFIHDDLTRDMIISLDGYRPSLTPSIFDHVSKIKSAREIHCMDSAFFHLIESMGSLKANLYFHAYVRRPYPDLPLRQPWRILNELTYFR